MIAMEIATQLGEKRWDDEFYVFIDNYIKTYQKMLEENTNIHMVNAELIAQL